MNIIHVKNKNGVTYVYESNNYWDKVKKQSRSKRVCIGKLDDHDRHHHLRQEVPCPGIIGRTL